MQRWHARSLAVLGVWLAASGIAAGQVPFEVVAPFSPSGIGYGYAPLIQATDGHLYGTTPFPGDGAVFRMTTTGTMTVLHVFPYTTFGFITSGLLQATDGNFYGTTAFQIFRMTPGGTVTILHEFDPFSTPRPSALIQAADGSLYGTTYADGPYNVGTIFRITTGGAVTILHTFNGSDGAWPTAGLIQGTDGNFYGSMYDTGVGAIFRMAPDGTVTRIHTFSNSEGYAPEVRLLQGMDGDFYGVAPFGGRWGNGTVFRMTPAGVLTVVHAFTAFAGGYGPHAALVQASDGTLYGTTSSPSGGGNGVVFSVKPSGAFHVLHSMGGADGAQPFAPLLRASDGRLYGTTYSGGPANLGVVFRVDPAAPTCEYGVSYSGGTIPLAGGSGSASVTAAPDCAWTAGTAAYWMHVTSGAGTGNGTVTFTVEPSHHFTGSYPPRSALLAVADQSVVIDQEGCDYEISPDHQSFFGTGGPGSVTVATGPHCPWSTSTDASWISFGVGSGTGNGTMTFNVARNTSVVSRQQSVAVGDRILFVTQGPRCDYGLSSATTTFGPGGGAGSASISDTCGGWTVTTGASWIAVDANSGSGDATLTFTVQPNTVAGPPRSTTITVGDQTMLVTQRGRAVPGEFSGDGRADITVFHPSTGEWRVLQSDTGFMLDATYSWGLSTDRPVPGDYDGDGKVDPAVFRPSTGFWYVLKSGTDYTSSFGVSWGLSTDVPEPGDYDGDGVADPAVYRPSTGGWYVLRSSTHYTSSFGVSWGLSTDMPMQSDYDGDGTVDPAVFRPSTGGWYVLKSSTSYTSSFGVSWGLSTDVAVPGDYDGDGRTDPAVFRPSTGGWYVLRSGTGYTTSFGVSWGLSTDLAVLKRP